MTSLLGAARQNHFTSLALILCITATSAIAATPCVFDRSFAPHEGLVKSVEQPLRAELCLNGLWQFQPLPLPAGYRHAETPTPELTPAKADAWDPTPIKIPSPWNVNHWGPGRLGRDVGQGTRRPYEPDSEFYPSYPPSWDGAQLGWLRRSFRVPTDWSEKRVLLHFEAVSGQFQVFINGAKAGEHFDSHLPAEFDITSLIRRDGDNELLVGVRHPFLFDHKSAKYPHFLAPFPPGSNTDSIVGIWQDVYLLGLPTVRIEDLFIQPLVDQNRLDVVATLRNDSSRPQSVQLDGQVHPWINLAGDGVLNAPESKWRLGDAVLTLPVVTAQLEPGASVNVTLTVRPENRLKLWSPHEPNLNGLVLSLRADGKKLDTRYERFGWRQLSIQGRDLRLNGEPIKLCGDFCHPFGPFMMSRRFAWTWYRMIKECGGNSIRPHAQPYPRYFLDVADEAGILVLDETAVFGSSIRLNPEDPAFWTRYVRHYERLIRRDRNHPSVFGWSFGNEMFAIPMLNKMTPEDKADYYSKLTETGLRAREWDPTRPWISCDGDEDLSGKLPVWSKHYGHDLPQLPEVQKPQMVGESGGTYYARPEQLAMFNGDRAYENYHGRNEALAIDLYQNIVKLALPKLAVYSPSEMIWFGLEHLPYGRRDFSRLPTLAEGVFFCPFTEGKPGMQPERIPPYCGTLNPGWDSTLPLYRPMAMFEAMKAALAPNGPQPSPWDHRPPKAARSHPAPGATIDRIAFCGEKSGRMFTALSALGVPFSNDATACCIVDGNSVTAANAETAKAALARVADQGGVAWITLTDPSALDSLNRLLPAPLALTTRSATMLQRATDHPLVSGFSAAELYFAEAEKPAQRLILNHGLSGPLAAKAVTLLQAGQTDWSLFNQIAENAKCGSVVLYEQLEKPAGAALIELVHGKGRLLISSIELSAENAVQGRLWQQLMRNAGVCLTPSTATGGPTGTKKAHDLLLDGPTNEK